MEVDCIIIGQGICGTLLSWNLLKRGKRIIVIDCIQPAAASRVASGLINPISGMRLVKAPHFEAYLSFFEPAYKELELAINAPVIAQYSMLHFHEGVAVKHKYYDKSTKLAGYIHAMQENNWERYFEVSNGVSRISPCWLVDLATLLDKWRKKLADAGMIISEPFDWNECSVAADGVVYKGIKATKLICCDGIAAQRNPFFSNLPFTQNKGEVLLASIPRLPRGYMYKHGGIAIIPWQQGLFWVGSSFGRDFTDLLPSQQFRQQTTALLAKWLRLPYAITGHLAAQRPTTIDRMPFAGYSREYPSVAILNGMGTKACMLAPYYAHCFSEHLLNGAPLPPEIDINRFRKQPMPN